MRIAIGSDHGGFELKEKITKHLEDRGIDFKDFGTYSNEACDYNDVSKTVAENVTQGNYTRGILICGTGIGTTIQANKVKGIRAALVHDVFTAKATREHNDSNVLSMGGRIIGDELAKMIVDTWLDTAFSQAERHQRRIDKLES